MFFVSRRRRHTRSKRDWSSDVCSSDLGGWAARADGASMSIAIEPAGLSETQRQIVELAREFARTRIEPFAAEWDRTDRKSVVYGECGDGGGGQDGIGSGRGSGRAGRTH